MLGPFTVFTRRVLYDVHDVTHLLGETPHGNRSSGGKGGTAAGTIAVAIAVTLGNGWYSQPTVGLGPRMALVHVAVDYANQDGTHGDLVVPSTGAWQAATGPTTLADIYLGATHDARLETPGWERPGYDHATAPGRWTPATVLPSPLLPGGIGVLRAQTMPRIRRCETFRPVSVKWFPKTAAAAAVWVVDFGQYMHCHAPCSRALPSGLERHGAKVVRWPARVLALG